jgi:hypothetical protein
MFCWLQFVHTHLPVVATWLPDVRGCRSNILSFGILPRNRRQLSGGQRSVLYRVQRPRCLPASCFITTDGLCQRSGGKLLRRLPFFLLGVDTLVPWCTILPTSSSKFWTSLLCRTIGPVKLRKCFEPLLSCLQIRTFTAKPRYLATRNASSGLLFLIIVHSMVNNPMTTSRRARLLAAIRKDRLKTYAGWTAAVFIVAAAAAFGAYKLRGAVRTSGPVASGGGVTKP